LENRRPGVCIGVHQSSPDKIELAHFGYLGTAILLSERGFSVVSVVQAPIEMIEEVAALRFPARTDERIQQLMDRNTNGTLSPEELEDLEALVELSETIGLVRAKALRLLGHKPT
jgi:hypothetical protein